mgnify:CR=1 FL=1
MPDFYVMRMTRRAVLTKDKRIDADNTHRVGISFALNIRSAQQYGNGNEIF